MSTFSLQSDPADGPRPPRQADPLGDSGRREPPKKTPKPPKPRKVERRQRGRKG